MKRPSKKKARPKRFRHAPPGTAPGMIQVSEDALRQQIRAFVFSSDGYTEKELSSVEEIRQSLAGEPEKIHWIDIKGFGSMNFLEGLADCFGIHRLQMEDVVNVYQRPKAEEYTDHLFLISRAIIESENGLSNDQISIFLGSNYVLTIQEKYDDLLDPVRDRIRNGKGFLRRHGADYLAFALMDAALDSFYPVLEHIGDKLDDLQDELIANPTHEALNRVLSTKRDLIMLRRTIWSERDKMNDILRSNFTQVKEGTKIFFRDSYDHCIQILDLVESSREVTASLMDVYHSSVSNRLNQVMKVLTIISTVFIPLTFIVGVYGMNFADVDPKTGERLPMNMPELYSPYGYAGVMVLMGLIVIFQLYFFVKKGWLTRG